MIFAILTTIILNAFFIIGLCEASEPGMLLNKPKVYLEKILPRWLFKPVWGCAVCMSSLHGVYFFILSIVVFGYDIELLYAIPFYIPALSGFVSFFYNLIPLAPEIEGIEEDEPKTRLETLEDWREGNYNRWHSKEISYDLYEQNDAKFRRLIHEEEQRLKGTK